MPIQISNYLGKNKTIVSVFLLILALVALAGVFTTVQLSQRNQDNRSDAAIDTKVEFKFEPFAVSTIINTEKTANLYIDTKTLKLTAAVVAIKYNPEYIEIIELKPTNILPVTIVNPSIDNAAGKAEVTVGAQAAQNSGYVGSGAIATIKYKAKKPVESSLVEYDSGELAAAVYGSDTNAAVVAGTLNVNARTASNPTPTPTATLNPTPTPTVIPTPTPTVVPTPTPTAIPTPTPTAVPTPTPLPPNSSAFAPSFRLQGVNKGGIAINNVEIALKYELDGVTQIKKYTKNYTSTASGTLNTAAFSIDDLPGLSTKGTLANVEVFIKAPTSLRKKVGTVTLKKGSITLVAGNTTLPVGDFLRTPDSEANKIKMNDIALALVEFKQLSNPVNDVSRAYDVDFNNVFNLQDIAIILTNYDSLVYPGDEL